MRQLYYQLRLEAGRTYHIQIIVGDTIATLYVGCRPKHAYVCKSRAGAAIYVVDGKLTLETL